MVWKKSGATRHHTAGDANCDTSTARNNGRSKCRGESFRFRSSSYSNTAGTNAAARISESRTEGSTGDY